MPALVDVETHNALKVLDGIFEYIGVEETNEVRIEIKRCNEIFDKFYYIPDSGYKLISEYSSALKDNNINCNDILDRHNNKSHKSPEYNKIGIESIANHEIDDKGNELWKIDFNKASNSLVEAYDLQVSSDRRTIHWFDGQIYDANGEGVVANILYKILKNEIETRDVKEVNARIRAMLCVKPTEFDRNPYLLGVKNGVIDLESGEFRDYKADDYLTDQLPIIYDPSASCPNILEFLGNITLDMDDKETLLDIIACGAIKQPIPMIAFILGGGSSGSSEFFKLIDKIYGSHNCVGLSLDDIDKDDFAESELINKRFCLGREVEDDRTQREKIYSASKLKKWTGGDRGSFRRKFLSRSDNIIFAKPVFAGNSMPKFNDRTYAFIRRLVCVKFPFRFVEDPKPGTNEKKRVKDIVDSICTPEELSGFLNVILARIPYIIEHGQIHKKAISFQEVDETTDSAHAFLNKFLEFDESSSDTQISKDLYAKYEKWVKARVANKVDARIFGAALREFCDGKKGKKTSRMVDGKKESIETYAGLSFKELEYDLEMAAMELKLKNTASIPPVTASNTAST
jgi:P4 family phage/plasmid primase-like protien